MQTVRPDFTLRMDRVFKAPRAFVFDAMTRPDMMRHWMCPADFTIAELRSDPRVGGRFHVEMRSPEGESFGVGGAFLELRRPDLMVFTWQWDPGHTMAGVETVIRVDLVEEAGATMMKMTHSGLASAAEVAAHQFGWSGAWTNLAALLERETDG
jgi:uncharacterized protein YndB with AHSA1/START domain